MHAPFHPQSHRSSYIVLQAAARRLRPSASTLVGHWHQRRSLATPSEPYDAVIIGGGECTRSVCAVCLNANSMSLRSRWLRSCNQGSTTRSPGMSSPGVIRPYYGLQNGRCHSRHSPTRPPNVSRVFLQMPFPAQFPHSDVKNP